MKEDNNNKMVSVAITFSGSQSKYSYKKEKMVMVTKRTSYKTLISLPVLCETEVNGKTIYDESLYDFTLRRIKHKFNTENALVTMMYLYNICHDGWLRDENETDLHTKLKRRGLVDSQNDKETEVKLEIYEGEYTGKTRFDKITHYDELLKRRWNRSWDWLNILSFNDAEDHYDCSYREKSCSEEYANLIWNIWKKHLDGNLKEYSVFFSNSRDYEKIEYEVKVCNSYRDRSESIWKPKKKVLTGTIKGISRYDAINKYQNNETDLENVKYVSIDEVPDDSIRLGNVVVCHRSFQPNEIPKESYLLKDNTSKKEWNKDFTLPEGARFVEPEIKEVA
tara:strand:- start:45 stop:1052 length:1008 start_codon:yes stop_codon:yes gene_type:complete